MKEVPIFIVLSIGYSQDMAFAIIGEVLGAYWSESDAVGAAGYEQIGVVEINNRQFRRETMIIKTNIALSGNKKLSEAHVVWSNAFAKDSTGRCAAKIVGVYPDEEQARAKFNEQPNGMVIIEEMPWEAKNNIVKVPIK